MVGSFVDTGKSPAEERSDREEEITKLTATQTRASVCSGSNWHGCRSFEASLDLGAVHSARALSYEMSPEGACIDAMNLKRKELEEKRSNTLVHIILLLLSHVGINLWKRIIPFRIGVVFGPGLALFHRNMRHYQI